MANRHVEAVRLLTTNLTAGRVRHLLTDDVRAPLLAAAGVARVARISHLGSDPLASIARHCPVVRVLNGVVNSLHRCPGFRGPNHDGESLLDVFADSVVYRASRGLRFRSRDHDGVRLLNVFADSVVHRASRGLRFRSRDVDHELLLDVLGDGLVHRASCGLLLRSRNVDCELLLDVLGDGLVHRASAGLLL